MELLLASSQIGVPIFCNANMPPLNRSGLYIEQALCATPNILRYPRPPRPVNPLYPSVIGSDKDRDILANLCLSLHKIMSPYTSPGTSTVGDHSTRSFVTMSVCCLHNGKKCFSVAPMSFALPSVTVLAGFVLRWANIFRQT